MGRPSKPRSPFGGSMVFTERNESSERRAAMFMNGTFYERHAHSFAWAGEAGQPTRPAPDVLARRYVELADADPPAVKLISICCCQCPMICEAYLDATWYRGACRLLPPCPACCDNFLFALLSMRWEGPVSYNHGSGFCENLTWPGSW